MNDIIYLDNNATTPLDPRVLEAMMPYLTHQFGNASSNHRAGATANQAVKKAREQVSELIGANSNEIAFTSGATEAINTVIKGIIEYRKEKGSHIVTISTEHPAVLDTCSYLENKGIEVTYLPVDSHGVIDLEQLKEIVRDDTILVCAMIVNNETGVIQPIDEISKIAHEKDAFFMTDGTQAVGKMDVDVNKMGIDILAFSGHKFYGPKGVGGLYVRSKRPFKVKLEALIHGGGHERGIRSGTLNVPGIVGIGKAAEIAGSEMKQDEKRIRSVRDRLESSLLEIPDSKLNGHLKNRLYNVTNICFHGADADAMIASAEDLAFSNGSACSTTKIEPSHVLMQMGLIQQDAYSSLRLSLGRFNTDEEIEYAFKTISKAVSSLRQMAN